MAIQTARLAIARRSTLTLSLCAALAAAAGSVRQVDAHSGASHPAAMTRQTAPGAFAPFGAFSDSRTSALPHRVSGNVIPGTNCADDGSAGSLRKAIEGASDGDTIDMSGLACSLITLQSGPLASAVPNLILKGPGVDALTIDGNHADRVLTGENLDIADVTIAHGLTYSQYGGGCISSTGDLSLTRAKLDGCSAVVSSASAPGGAARVLGNLTMHAAAISGSSASAQKHAGGGGAFVLGSSALYDSTISGNIAQSALYDAYGGGLMAFGTVTLHHSSISSNQAESSYGRAYGGGMHARGDIDVSILDASSIVGNTAYSASDSSYGGGINDGIYSTFYSSTVKIERSTITGNTATSNCPTCVVAGGGVHAFDSIASDYSTFSYNSVLCDPTSSCLASGGGLASFGAGAGSKIELRNTTVSGNEVIGGTSGAGGGVITGSDKPLIAKNSTIAFNHASHQAGGVASTSPANLPSTIDSTIVSNNDTDAGPNDIDVAPFGLSAKFDGANNLAVIWTVLITMPIDTLTLDPALLPLTTDAGGVTAVHPLSANSFAIDAGSNPDSLGCDQRGYPYRRIYGAAADIGAYEEQGEKHLFADNFDGNPSCPPAGP